MSKRGKILLIIFAFYIFTLFLSYNFAKFNDVRKLNKVAVNYQKQGKIDEAISTLNSALVLKPRSFKTTFNLAINYIKQGNYNYAIEQLENAKRIKNKGKLYYFLAICHENLAMKTLEENISNDTQNGKFEKVSTNKMSDVNKKATQRELELAIFNYEKYLKKTLFIKNRKKVETQIQNLKDMKDEIK